MSVEVHEEAGGKILMVRLTGMLAKQDYEHFVPEVERLIGPQGKIRMLVQMHDFHSWTAGALWEDMKFNLKHWPTSSGWPSLATRRGNTKWPSSANPL
jgi:hypothetical protein